MKAILYYKDKQVVFGISKYVKEVGPDFITGEQTFKGIDTNVLDFIVVDDESINDELKPGDLLPIGLIDKKSTLVKASLSDLGKELSQTKLENLQMKSTIDSLGKEITNAKLEIIQLKGGIA